MLLVRIFDTLTDSVLKHQTCALKSNGVTHVDINSLAHLMDSFFYKAPKNDILLVLWRI